jgi:hypothetical protein
MGLAVDSRTEDLLAELSALRQERTYLASEIKSNPAESLQRLEAMIRYSYVVADVREVSTELRERGAAF